MNTPSQLPRNRFKVLFETIIQKFDEVPVLSGEILKAKEEFFRLTGKLKDQDEDFTNRMNCFLLWFTYDWRSPSLAATPLEHHLDLLVRSDQESDREFLEHSQHHIHSLFNFLKQKQDVIVVQDVFTGKKYRITDNHKPIGHIKGSLFETRIFSHGDDSFFADYFIHHPVLVKKGILKKLKQIRKQKKGIKSFLHQLHAFHTKWTHYRNISIHSIYHFDSSIPVAK